VKAVITGIIYVLPNVEHSSLRSHVVHEVAVPAMNVLMLTGYACIYAVILLEMATILFRHRDIQ